MNTWQIILTSVITSIIVTLLTMHFGMQMMGAGDMVTYTGQESGGRLDASSGDNDIVGAVLIDTNKEYTGSLGDDDTDDYVRVDVEKGHTFSFKLVPDEGLDVGFDIFDARRNEVTYDMTGAFDYNTGTFGVIEQFTFANGESATESEYYLHVFRTGGEGDYHVIVSSLEQDDADSGVDASDSIGGAYELTSGTYKGYLGYGDKYDSYTFDIDEVTQLSVLGKEDLAFDIYDSKNNDVTYDMTGSFDYNQGGAGVSEVIELQPGKYGIVVWQMGVQSDYTVTLEPRSETEE
jgi:hypothetical protein